MGIFSRQSSVGIDITAHSVKLLELVSTRRGFQVKHFAIVPLADQVVQNNNIKEVASLVEAIQQAKRLSKTAARYAHIAVPSSSVITRVIQVDATMGEAELEAHVALTADRYVPYPMEEVNLDFEVQGPSEERVGQHDALVVASRREIVEPRVDAVEEAGFKVKTVDVELYAMERAAELIVSQLPAHGEEKTVAIIDVGTQTTTLTVVKNLMVIYTREETFGGQHITEVLQQTYNISFEQAENLKVDRQLEGGAAIDTAQVAQLIHEETLPHIRRQLQFFFAAYEAESIEHLVLSGGSALNEGLTDFLEDKLSLTVSRANPFEQMQFADTLNQQALLKEAPRMMICCGLAVRGLNHG